MACNFKDHFQPEMAMTRQGCMFLHLSLMLLSFLLFQVSGSPHVFTHRLRTPNKAFFHWNPGFLGLLGIFGQTTYQHPFRSMFSIIQPLFLQKLILYIHIPNFNLGLEFDFLPQRIRDLVFVCLQFVFTPIFRLLSLITQSFSCLVLLSTI